MKYTAKTSVHQRVINPNPSQIGTRLSQAIREGLMAKLGCTYDEAYNFTLWLEEQHLQWVDWLELYDGTTFEKTFVPHKR